jgi:hypothetical protein
VHRHPELRERERGDRGHGSLGKAVDGWGIHVVRQAVIEIERAAHSDEATGAVEPYAARALGQDLRCVLRRADMERGVRDLVL